MLPCVVARANGRRHCEAPGPSRKVTRMFVTFGPSRTCRCRLRFVAAMALRMQMRTVKVVEGERIGLNQRSGEKERYPVRQVTCRLECRSWVVRDSTRVQLVGGVCEPAADGCRPPSRQAGTGKSMSNVTSTRPIRPEAGGDDAMARMPASTAASGRRPRVRVAAAMAREKETDNGPVARRHRSRRRRLLHEPDNVPLVLRACRSVDAHEVVVDHTIAHARGVGTRDGWLPVAGRSDAALRRGLSAARKSSTDKACPWTALVVRRSNTKLALAATVMMQAGLTLSGRTRAAGRWPARNETLPPTA